MKTLRDLIAFVQTGKQPIVTFGQRIVDVDEVYPEPGMRARLVHLTAEGDGMATAEFHYEEFESHNILLESPLYRNKDIPNGPKVKAQQSGFYHRIEEVYLDLDEVLEGLLTVESDAASALFETYKAESSALTYLQWLEAKVLAS